MYVYTQKVQWGVEGFALQGLARELAALMNSLNSSLFVLVPISK